jgi:hypothetical protein
VKWEVREAQLASVKLARLIEGGWDPFAAFDRNGKTIVVVRRASYGGPQ